MGGHLPGSRPVTPSAASQPFRSLPLEEKQRLFLDVLAG